jgi:hypothetical protein
MWQKKIFASAAILVLALMVAFPAAGLVAGESSTGTTDLSTTKSSILEAYGKLPLLFIENHGQVDEAVRYYVTSSGQTVYFTEENIVFDLIRYDQAEANDTADRQAERLVFSLDFLGANSQSVIEGSGKDGAVVNYLMGNDPEQWHANVPTYRELVYWDIYPNIDLRLYGDGGMLRYDFVVNPGATPEAIALAYNDIDSLAIIDGELVMGTAFGDMVQSQPHIYQQIGDEVVEVEGGFRLGSDNTYGFHVAAYNNHYPLIIDPLMYYSTYLGGTDDDFGNGIAVDTGGSAYVTGYTTSANFPTTQGAYDTSHNGGWTDVFVTKLSADGKTLVYSTYLGGTSADEGLGIALDSSNNAYITGFTNSADFPTTPGAFQVAKAGGSDAVITKLSPDGSTLVYSTYLGGTSDDSGHGIALNSNNNAYITGYTSSADFPTTGGAYQMANNGGTDAFVAKLGSEGNTLAYSTYLGGTSNDEAQGIALDSSNNAYITGGTDSHNFPTTGGAYQTAYNGHWDAFVTKLGPAGNALVYSTYLGGSTSDDSGYGIALNSNNNAYITGQTASADFPTTGGAYQTANNGGADAFVTKLGSAGNSLAYSTYLGGTDSDAGKGIALDSSNNAYITGFTNSADFPTTGGAYDTSFNGAADVFVTKLSSAGNTLAYSTYLGGEDGDGGDGIALDSSNNAYITGGTSSANFPTTPDAFQVANAGGYDAFVCKMSTGYNLAITHSAGGTVTTPGVGTFFYDAGTIVNLAAAPASGYQFDNWTGDIDTLATPSAANTTITMNGDYSITANFKKSGGGQGCFIATAAYGTPMAQEIQILREFRDEYLLTNPVGRAFVDFYYKVSPPMAEFITEHPSLKPIVRAGLVPAVALSTVVVNTTPAEKMAIVGLLVLVSVALAVWAKRRRGGGPQYT